MSIIKYIEKLAVNAKEASYGMAEADTAVKNRALFLMVQGLMREKCHIIKANKKDLKAAMKKGASKAFLDRLALTEKRIENMADSISQVEKLDDPAGKTLRSFQRPNGLAITKVSVPIGVIGIIYESRPDVTSDTASLCLKSGNCVILRGGSGSINSNMAIYKVLSRAAKEAGLPEHCVSLIEVTDRKAVDSLLKQDKYVDLIIPRGGEGLIREVASKSRIPVIKHYKGICHVYVDEYANIDMAVNISFNAKCQRPGVCNAMETLLVHQNIAANFLPRIARYLRQAGVELRGCEKTRAIVKGIKRAAVKDWQTEYLDLVLSIRVVKDLDQAIEHIRLYGSSHSDSIITEDSKNADEFLRRVDSACVYLNASTRFTDGNQFGMGAEIGISTDKIHARGPMALEELCSYKYIVRGNGQIRT